MPDYLPPMTLMQYYAKSGVIAVMGIAYCYLLIFVLPERDMRLGYRMKPHYDKMRNYVGYALFGLGALAGYMVVPKLFYGAVDDVSTTVADGVANAAGDLIEKGTGDFSVPMNSGGASGASEPWLLWGQHSAQQDQDFCCLLLFFVLIGWACYLFGFVPSYVGAGKKALKVLGHAALLVLMFSFPMFIHRFTLSEFVVPLAGGIVAAVCLVLAGGNEVAPPPLPEAAPPPLPHAGTEMMSAKNKK